MAIDKFAKQQWLNEQYMGVVPDHLLRMIFEAKQGDTIAARNALIMLTCMLGSIDTNQFTGEKLSEPMPIPTWARGYLFESLSRVLQGENPAKAFNLKRNGRPTEWSFYAKLKLADTVHYLHIIEKKTIEDSCMETADGINEVVQKYPIKMLQTEGLGHFIGTSKITQELVSKWYYELKDKCKFTGIGGKHLWQLIKALHLRNPL